jgi:hypothetical protein
MPDWFSHVLIGWMICEIFKVKPKWRALVYVGVLIPDIGKLFMVVDLFSNTSSHWFFEPFHTIMIPILVAGIFSQFFHNNKFAFICLAGGALLHLGTDIFQGTIESGYYLLFPATVKIQAFALFSSENIWMNVFVLIFAGPFIYFEVVKPLMAKTKRG